jgi:hypothetical protein
MSEQLAAVNQLADLLGNASAPVTPEIVQGAADGISEVLRASSELYPNPDPDSAVEAGKQVRNSIGMVVSALRRMTGGEAGTVSVTSPELNITVQSNASGQLSYGTGGAGNTTIRLPGNLSEAGVPVAVVMWTCLKDVHGGALNASSSRVGPTVSFSLYVNESEVTTFEEPLLLALPVSSSDEAARNCVGQPSERDAFERMRSGAGQCEASLQCKFWDTEAQAWSGEGCETVALNGTDNSVGCLCTHLTDFISIKVPGLSFSAPSPLRPVLPLPPRLNYPQTRTLPLRLIFNPNLLPPSSPTPA